MSNLEGNGNLETNNFEDSSSMGAIAIIGMNGRFPGAKNMDEFWQNLLNGVESVKFFNREELLKMGIDEHLLDNPRFVAADAIMDGMDQFDAAFFDYSAREAEIMDPQHRLFLESAWEVLESAGYNSDLYDGRIAVYAGANLSGYMVRNLYSNPGLVENVGTFKIMIANSQDFLATRVSYKMNLMGPSVNVNTLCSSSLVAVHMACQNLLNYSCDIALAGGVSFQISRNEAFFYQEGGIGSGDGHCRAYDSKANGTVSGSGLAVVVLKRLEDAINDGDCIHAVIKGVGINNDGSNKNSFTAPNVEGQAECIAEAIAMSGVDPETITYIDGHGTGTDLGDPIEISALTKAFRAYTKKKQFCAIGSVKTNIGHLVTAGGLASVAKTVLALKHRVIPPSLNFEEPNPKIDFLNTPFYVNNKLSQWKTDGYPLRAGVSSFGIGGTNTHVILEEAPQIEQSEESKRPWQLIALSAKTACALEKMTANLLEHISKNPETNLADTAFTLHAGRRNFSHRRMVVCKDTGDLMKKLAAPESGGVFSRFQKPKEQPVVFMFPGKGHYENMGLELYRTEPSYRKTVDKCKKLLESLGIAENLSIAAANIALFITEYAMAKLWMEWEVKPQYMIGEGVGEYAAACLSGVMSLEDALLLAAAGDGELPGKVRQISLKAPGIPFISNVTGAFISDLEASSLDYWIQQRRGARFTEGLKEILNDPDQILLEIGPGNRLCQEAYRLSGEEIKQDILRTMPGEADKESCSYVLLESAGKFWLAGCSINWFKLYKNEKRHRIPLPTYPFERQRYWIEPGKRSNTYEQPGVLIKSKEDIKDSNSKYKEGTVTVTLKLDNSDKQKLEELLLFKEKLEEFCKSNGSISSEIVVSPLSLKAEDGIGNTTRTSDGRLNKRPRPALETAYEGPRNDVEKVIAEKWQEVLGFDTIGIHDNFFELGGHSLIAAAVASELGKVFDMQIPLRKIFEAATVEEVAEMIETYRWASQGAQQADSGEDELDDGTI